jgi:hypothetical protein
LYECDGISTSVWTYGLCISYKHPPSTLFASAPRHPDETSFFGGLVEEFFLPLLVLEMGALGGNPVSHILSYNEVEVSWGIEQGDYDLHVLQHLYCSNTISTLCTK